MGASVRPLRLLPDAYGTALEAFRAAELRACVFALHGIETTTAAALRARALIRLREFEAALYAASRPKPDDDPHGAQLALLRGTAYLRLDDPGRSETELQDAERRAVASGDVLTQIEVLFIGAQAALAARAYERQRVLCARALELADAARLSPPVREPISAREHLVARLHTLIGVSYAAEGRYEAQIACARRALATIEASPLRDVFEQSISLLNLAVLTRDFDLPEVEHVRTRIADQPWTSDIAKHQCIAAESIAWNFALHGDTVEAYRLLRVAEAAATMDAERVVIGVTRSVLASEAGFTAFAREEIEHVLKLSDRIQWEETKDHYRYGLLVVAQASAKLDPLRARSALERYRRIQTKMDVGTFSQYEERIDAEESYTEGLVRRGEGRLAESLEPLRRAFEIWERIGFAWRAGRAALELAELDAGDAFRLAVRREVHLRPASFYAKRARLIA